MNYPQKEEQVVTEGQFVTHGFGYYSFELQNDEVLIFEEIDQRIFSKYDLTHDTYQGKSFEITYSIITEDLEDEDFVVLRLDNLQLLTNNKSIFTPEL